MATAAPEASDRDFFISYTKVDKAWAVWIAVELEKAGYTTIVQAFDSLPGSDFVHEMQDAVQNTRRTIAVLSPEYFDSDFSEAEWRTTFASDPGGTALKLVPVRVREVQPPTGLLRTRVYIDLFELSEDAARDALLKGVSEKVTRPTTAEFPGPTEQTLSATDTLVRGPGTDPGFPIPYPGRNDSAALSTHGADSAFLTPADRLNQRLVISSDTTELAKAYSEAGRYYIAAQLLEDIAIATQHLRGSDHPDTLTSRNNLAIAYRAAGRIEDAIAMHEKNLADRERVLGPDHPDTLASGSNLAVAYRAAGRTEEAIMLYEQTLADRERVLGPDHPDTLTSRNNLAVAYRAADRTEEAIILYEQNLADRERVLGPDHRSTLASRNNLAYAYQVAGRTEEAVALHEQTLINRERVLGPDHPDTLQSRNNLGDAERIAIEALSQDHT